MVSGDRLVPTILYPWARTRDEQQVETLRFLLDMVQNTLPDLWHVRSREMIKDTDYAKFVKASLTLYDAPFFIVEQDMIPTRSQMENLQQCIEHVCVIPYRRRDGKYSIWNTTPAFALEPPFPKHVYGTALGFIKIDRTAINAIRNMIQTDTHWSLLDMHISELLVANRFLIHVHDGEVVHNRTPDDPRG